MLCGVQISSGMYWENANESAWVLVLRDQLPKTVSLGALSKQKKVPVKALVVYILTG